MEISLIVAMGTNRVIGRDNKIPWHLPADMRFFKETTMGKPIIMGRKTYESLGHALPGRRNIVMSRNKEFKAEGCTVVGSLAEALEVAVGEGEIMIIGGEELYRLFLPFAKRIYLTVIEADFIGDSFFPMLDTDVWVEVSRRTYEPDESWPYRYHFTILERVEIGEGSGRT